MVRPFLAAVVAAIFAQVYSQTVTDASLTVETMASGLTQPTAFVFLGPNTYLVTEKTTGKVRYVKNGVLQAAAPLDLPVANDSERGLLSIALDPDFNSNHFVYLYYSNATADGGTWTDNRCVRYLWNTGTETLGSPLQLVSFPSSGTDANGPNHDGGPLVIGPDKKIYGVTGDLNRNGLEQNFETAGISGVGGIYRLNLDGTIPADNPFNTGSIDPAFKRLFAYGVRNCFGMTIDSKTGRLWDTENGENTYDEINMILSGFNSGWEDIMGPISRSGKTLANLYFVSGAAFYRDPDFSWLATIAPTGCAFLHSANFSTTIRDNLVLGDNNNGFLYMFTPNATRDGFVLSGGVADKVADSAAERDLDKWGSGWGVVTGVKIGLDGNLWVISLSQGKVYRIKPVTAPNTISGIVTLGNFTALPTGTPLTIQLKTGATIVETVSTTVGSFGEYYISTTHSGTYDLVAKCSHWLAEKTLAVSVGPGTAVNWNMQTNGDLVQDNVIDLYDLNQALVDFGTSSSDVDGNGTDDLSDLNLIFLAFGMIGAS